MCYSDPHWRASLPSERANRLGLCLRSRAWGSSGSPPNSCCTCLSSGLTQLSMGRVASLTNPHKKYCHPKLLSSLWPSGRLGGHSHTHTSRVCLFQQAN